MGCRRRLSQGRRRYETSIAGRHAATGRDPRRNERQSLAHPIEPALPPAVTAWTQASIPIRLGQPRPAWVTLLREDGSLERFQSQGDYVVLPPQPIGRHRLLNEDRPERFCHLTVAPRACYLPPTLVAGERRFGIAAHLYTLRSRGDQGIGDFTTLARFAVEAAHTGASMVGLNPLHALFPHDRSRASPYQPSDRRFLDPIYIDVSGFPGGAELPSPSGPVDYPAVWERKRAILDAAFTAADQNTIPDALRRFAIFETIAEVLGTSHWQAWPVELRHPESPDVAAFARQHRERSSSMPFCRALPTASSLRQPRLPPNMGCPWASTGTSPSEPRRTERRLGQPRTH